MTITAAQYDTAYDYGATTPDYDAESAQEVLDDVLEFSEWSEMTPNEQAAVRLVLGLIRAALDGHHGRPRHPSE